MPCRNVLPKPRAEAASADVDGLHQPRHHQDRGAATASARSRSPSSIRGEARTWSRDLLRHHQERRVRAARPHASTPTSPWSRPSRCTRTAAEAIRRGQEGFEFFGYALNALVAHDTVPGRSDLWERVPGAPRAPTATERRIAAADAQGDVARERIGTPGDMPHAPARLRGRRRRPGDLPAAGRPQPRTTTSASRSSCSPREVLPEFKAEAAEREARKAEELAPVHRQAALARKKVDGAARRRRHPRRARLGRQSPDRRLPRLTFPGRPVSGNQARLPGAQVSGNRLVTGVPDG